MPPKRYRSSKANACHTRSDTFWGLGSDAPDSLTDSEALARLFSRGTLHTSRRSSNVGCCWSVLPGEPRPRAPVAGLLGRLLVLYVSCDAGGAAPPWAAEVKRPVASLVLLLPSPGGGRWAWRPAARQTCATRVPRGVPPLRPYLALRERGQSFMCRGRRASATEN
jgi:hypothetical protein